jgi:hypothetical protein
VDELYVLARRVLLDALVALGEYRESIVLVGAQAIYLHVGEADLAVAPYTTDGDLALDPATLATAPPLEGVLRAADFQPKSRDSVGIWVTHRPTSLSADTEVAVDLLVPAAVSPGKGRRAARLLGHDPHVARLVNGLEGALVDHDRRTLTALDQADGRTVDIRVAGPAALLVAKLHKINERMQQGREGDKDGLDVLRLMRGVTTEELARRLRVLAETEISSKCCTDGLTMLRELFATRTAPGAQMAVRATAGLADAEEIALSCELLSGDLLEALRRP